MDGRRRAGLGVGGSISIARVGWREWVDRGIIADFSRKQGLRVRCLLEALQQVIRQVDGLAHSLDLDRSLVQLVHDV